MSLTTSIIYTIFLYYPLFPPVSFFLVFGPFVQNNQIQIILIVTFNGSFSYQLW